MKPPRSVAFQAAMPPFVGACFFRAAALTLLALSAAVAQPGQLLGPAQQSRMQDSNLKPAHPGALQGVVRIPVAQAIEVLAKRGLPSRSVPAVTKEVQKK